MNLSLTPQLEQYIKNCAATGEYNNASEVVREALRLFIRTEEERQLKLKNLRLAIQKGDDAMINGEMTELTSANELVEFFETL